MKFCLMLHAMYTELTGIKIFDYLLTMLTNAFINDVEIHKEKKSLKYWHVIQYSQYF